MKRLFLVLLMLLLASCNTTAPQEGGNIHIVGKVGTAEVVQPENAKEDALLVYDEDSIRIEHKPNDELNITVETHPNGRVTREIDFNPVNEGTTVVSTIHADANTGSSFKDMARELNVFLQSAKIVLYVGIGFLVAGGLWAGFVRDFKTAGILAGIGMALMVGYAVLPQLYAHWAWIVLGLLIIPPILWFLHHRRTDRIGKAAQRAHLKMKEKYPEYAKESSLLFKEHLYPNDIKHVSKAKQQYKKL